MAKRDRVPGRKSLGSAKRKRNKNPKLSPFQREQKRDRLANQPPVESKNKRDFPAKHRAVFQYLQEKKARDDAKMQLKRERDEQQGIAPAPMGKARLRKLARLEGQTDVSQAAAAAPVVAKKDSMPSLNEEVRLGAVPLANRVDSVILRKKEKKHEKRVERRKERITEKMNSLEAELTETLKKRDAKAKKKKGGKVESTGNARDDAYEKQLIRMQKEKAVQDAAAAKVAKAEAAAAAKAEVAANGGKKRISFDTTESPEHVVARPAPKTVPRDFYHMVDVVRYGDRVEAPPVFDVIPDSNNAVSKLAKKLSAEEEMALRSKRRPTMSSSTQSSGSDRAAIFSQSGDAFAEQKRLASLGLAHRITGTVSTKHSDEKRSTASMEDEFATLRNKVMASYQRNKALRYQGQSAPTGTGSGSKPAGGATGQRSNTANRDGPVNLKHQFPLI